MNLVSGGLTAGTITSTLAAPPRARASTSLALTGGAYHAGSYGSQELAGWHPSLRSPDAEVLPARDKVVARSRDLDRNNGWAQGGVSKRTDAVVGADLRLRATPNYAAMRQTPEWADKWSRATEAEWRSWANDYRALCDAERHHQFGGLVRLAYQHYVIDGEAAAVIMYRQPGDNDFQLSDRDYRTAVLILDPDRLSNPDGRADGRGLDGVQYRGGVELDSLGGARAYWVRNSHPGDVGGNWEGQRWARVPREDATGRPRFVHAINKRRAHQHRSLGMLSSVMGRMKMLDRYDATELQAAITNAVFGLYVTSNSSSDSLAEALAPADDAPGSGLDYMANRIAYHEKADLTLDGVRLAHLWDKEEIKAVAPNRPNTNFAGFESAVLGSIASALGISREQLSQDWTGINYSSARTLLNEIWRGLIADRHLFTQAFCTPIYAAWLEEAVARKLVEVPGGQMNFYTHRAALCQARWIGPGKGWVDPKKEAEAAELRMKLGISSQTDECSEQGRDADEVRWQRKRDQEANDEYGLSPSEPAATDAAPAAEDPDAADRRETAGEDA